MYRYYSTQRPIVPGAYPRHDVVIIENFSDKRPIESIGREAWGFIDYEKPLTEKECFEYELVSADVKTWVSVITCVFDTGIVACNIKDTVKAITRPEERCKELKSKTIYENWFDSLDAARAFVEEITI